MIFGYVQAVANADPSSARRRVHADIQQAEYFLELLGDEYAELSERLTHHRTELVTYEHVGDLPDQSARIYDGLDVSRDGRWLFLTYFDREDTDLMLIDNFR